MKTNYSPTLHHGFNFWPVFPFLIFIFTLYSCSELRNALMGSLDSNHQVYNYGDRGSRSTSPNESQVGFNIGWISVINAFYGDEFFFDAVQVNRLEYDLLASTSNSNYFSLTNEKRNAFSRGMDISGFKEHIYVITGVEFITKRSKDGNERVTLNYLEIPFYGVYKTDIGSGDIFAGFGPYLAYGIGGKIKTSGQGGDSVGSFNSETGLRRFDAGFGILGGYQFANNITVFMGYNWGFANLSRDNNDAPINNRTFSLNMMYPLANIIR